MKESKIIIFETGKDVGIFSDAAKFYPPNMTKNERYKLFLEVKDRAGEKIGISGKKFFQPNQKTETNNLDYPDGKYVVINKNNMTKDDYWEEEIPSDILILEEQYKGVVLGNKMSDCPIVIIEDRAKGVTALSHCGAAYIDRYLPKQTAEALIKQYNSNIEDLYVYVGSCAKKETYIYDTYPKWAKHKELWSDNIIKDIDGYHIDMNGAIRKQLKEIGIINIDESSINTMTDDKYYSHREASKGNKDKLGQNFVGFYYKY